MAIDRESFPICSMVIFHSYVNVYQKVYSRHTINIGDIPFCFNIRIVQNLGLSTGRLIFPLIPWDWSPPHPFGSLRPPARHRRASSAGGPCLGGQDFGGGDWRRKLWEIVMPLCISINWLVVYLHPWKIWVNWDEDIPNDGKIKHVPNHQSVNH